MNKIVLITACILLAAIGVVFYIVEKNASVTPVAAIEKVRNGHVDEMVLQKEIGRGQVILYLRNINENQQIVSAEYVKKTFTGWKWVYGGGHSMPKPYAGPTGNVKVDDSWSYQYFPSTEGTQFGKSPFPMLFGVINHADIQAIAVKDLNTNQEVMAKIVNTKGATRFWYVFVTEEQGRKFMLTARTNEGKVVNEKMIDEAMNNQTNANPRQL